MDSAFGWLLLVLVAAALPLGWPLLEMRRAAQAKGRPAPEHAEVPHEGVVLFYFHSLLCGPCRRMTPEMRAWAEEDARVRVIDIGIKPDLARAFGVRVTPTVVIVRDGRIDAVLLGACTRAQLEPFFR
ncbi:MAG: thioredoxin family protein [Gammaproteobacteria bacterium]|nr:thioredoxin family protein [Gammaproteobacteria bacterium]